MGIPVDMRADLYGAGLVLYMMLVGRGPFDHLKDEYNELIQAHVVIDPDPPSRFSDEPVPPEVDRIVLRALTKSADERYQTAREFREALLGVMDLLQRPTGWLETTAFDAAKLASLAPTEATPPDSNAHAVGSTQSAQFGPSPSARPGTDSSVGLSAVLPRVAPSRLTIVLVFLIGMLVAGLAAVGLVSVVMGVP
jgi:serine/threonine-protein kinase